VSEEINNNLFRQGHRAVGMSSGIIGSGMAFNYDYFKNMMKNVVAVSGFDKEIELIMSKAKTKIEYLNDAWVYDEKVQTSDVFVTQRRRWLYAQFYYFKQDFGTAVWHLLTRFNVDYFDKAIQFIQPPRVLLIGEVVLLTAIFGVANYLLNTAMDLTYGWIITLIACVLAFLFAVPKRYYNMETAKAVLGLPKGMILMTLALLQIKGANKQFLHTKHTSTKTAIKK
jgi:cellulose synthase/poly-beta-1,6-N-acetylglucosamine synthase-like glycosyltransferase